jgi:hypothetical protein
MLLGGVTTTVACVVALGLLGSPLDQTTVWRIAGGSTAIAMLSFFIAISAEAKREDIFSAAGFSRAHASVIYALSGGSVVLLTLSAATAGEPLAPGFFASAMIAMFTLSAIQFARAAIVQFAAARSRNE